MKQGLISFVFVALTVTGCNLTPDYQPATGPVPQDWRLEQSSDQDLKTFWQDFNSAELSRILANVRTENPDVLAAVQRVEQARAALMISRASLIPSASLAGSAQREVGGDSSGSISATVSYEADLFGRTRATVAASQASFQASAFDRKSAELAVTTEAARAYTQLLALKSRLHVTRDSHANQVQVMDLLQAQYDAGAISGMELEQQKSALAATEASLAGLERDIQITQNALAVLQGVAPQSFHVQAVGLAGLNIPKIAPTQPSELLTRRPDLLSAEAGLRAANANIGVARAAYFPTLSLSAGKSISEVFGDPSVSALSLAARLAQPLFQPGALSGQVERTLARREELAQNYRKAILIAYAEVEDALTRITAAQRRALAQQRSAQAAEAAYVIANRRYKEGAADFIVLLDAQRSVLSAREALVQASFDQISAAIDLYRALGGAPDLED